MREIVLDTETTGFDSRGVDRIIEIACLEIIDKKVTGKTFHTYVNPLRGIPESATKVHNIADDMVKNEPTFDAVAQNFMSFVGEDPLVIHNAPFDMGFLNAELVRHKFQTLPFSQAIDTLAIARRKFPGSNNTLDGLCKRFKIDLSQRIFHGALIDCELLARVYVELMGGKQKTLFTVGLQQESKANHEDLGVSNFPKKDRFFGPSEEELKKHNEFVEALEGSLWKKEAA